MADDGPPLSFTPPLLLASPAASKAAAAALPWEGAANCGREEEEGPPFIRMDEVICKEDMARNRRQPQPLAASSCAANQGLFVRPPLRPLEGCAHHEQGEVAQELEGEIVAAAVWFGCFVLLMLCLLPSCLVALS